MKDIQKVFDDIQELKKERRELNKEYKYLLDNDNKHGELVNKLKVFREKKKAIEDANKTPRLEEIKDEIADANQMISDIAVATLMNGESISLKDKYDTEYEPIYKVSFKKIK